ncbi:MerR family transcriptional regulator [Glaciihabitans sp. dw_435]|uniref:MerR family transcriptional regulator n=1 Tax=Glaciihabitans sp. dw_435 TaxID=2720081 RepID=UPI001BD51F5F|nr:MerR family transcriptional regulator [Glaciihabitans sp. dw_435]
MRISELSAKSGLPVPSIKFYLREGLLAAGDRTSPNQASYGDEHVERLRLVRALLEVGGLSVASARDVIAAIDDKNMPLDWTFGIAQHAIAGGLSIPESDIVGEPQTDENGAPQFSRATATSASAGINRVVGLIDAEGWSVSQDNPGIAMAGHVIDAYISLGRESLTATAADYARAAEIVAEADLDAVEASGDRSDMAEVVVVGTVLGDTFFAGLRRIAQENVSHRRYHGAPSPERDSRGEESPDSGSSATP